MFFFKQQTSTGFTLVEALVVIAVSTLVLSGVLVSVQYSLQLIANSAAKQSALSVATDRMEFFRSLPYDAVGTIGGLVPGNIPQNSTTTLNGIEFIETVIVEYVDDPADGQLTATTTDSNGIITDYKRVKIDIGWSLRGRSDSVTLVSNIVPRSIETTVGGGTIRVNVLDADSSFLSGVASGATVRLFNETTTPTIDTTRSVNGSGVALFSGAPAASNYQLFVSAPGYSSDQTYIATTSNPNPTVAPFTVLEADISTLTFQIGQLSDLLVQTLSDTTEVSVEETFADSLGVATSTDVTIAADQVTLTGPAGSYPSSGQVFLSPVTPMSLEHWGTLVVVANRPIGTNIKTQFYTGTTTSYELIDDDDLPGNALGFSEAIVDLSNLDIAAYSEITVGVTLESTNPALTPELDEVSLYYRFDESSRAAVALDVTGEKVIGEAADLTPIKKNVFSVTTDGAGEAILTDVEFDTYSFDTAGAYTLARSCPGVPLLHRAGATSSVELVLIPVVTDSLRVSVLSDSGVPLPGARVTLSRSGFTDTVNSDSCGQAFFGTGVAPNTDFTISVTRNGYAPQTIDPYSLSGNSEVSITLNQL